MQMYLPYLKREVVFCSQKVEKLANSMGFDVDFKASSTKITNPTCFEFALGRILVYGLNLSKYNKF
jgi:hypothetical protein